jgi:protease I
MSQSLKNKHVAVVATHGFEESEFTEPVSALKNAGATVDIIALKKGTIKAWAETDWGPEYPVDKSIDEVDAADYDALVLPGGVMNPDHLRVDTRVVRFVTAFMQEHKPVAAICHGPWTLIETGLLEGRQMTSYPSIKTDLINAGVDWVDQEVVVDNGLVTSRNPKDLPAFCRKMIEEIGEGIHV